MSLLSLVSLAIAGSTLVPFHSENEGPSNDTRGKGFPTARKVKAPKASPVVSIDPASVGSLQGNLGLAESGAIKGITSSDNANTIKHCGARVKRHEWEMPQEMKGYRVSELDNLTARWVAFRNDARDALKSVGPSDMPGFAERKSLAVLAFAVAYNAHEAAVAAGIVGGKAMLEMVFGVACIATPAELAEVFGSLASEGTSEIKVRERPSMGRKGLFAPMGSFAKARLFLELGDMLPEKVVCPLTHNQTYIG